MQFIIGFSKTGKSTLAKKYARVGTPIVSASDWIKELYPIMDAEDTISYRERITQHSVRLRADDPLIWVRWFDKQRLPQHTIVEGVRDPVDFMSVFNPSRDSVIFIEGGVPANAYDHGVKIILDYLKFLEQTERPVILIVEESWSQK